MADKSEGKTVEAEAEPKPPVRRTNFMEDALLGTGPRAKRPRKRSPDRPTEWDLAWKRFKGNDSPASVLFGFASIITTIILAWATITLASNANALLDQQNDLILADSLPSVSASLLPNGDGGFSLAVENSGSSATFRSIEPVTLIRFTFEKYDDRMEHGYVALYDVFETIEAGSTSTGPLASVTSVPGVTTKVDEVCAAIVAVDSRITHCQLDVSLIVRYQTNTDDIYASYYRFEDEVALQVAAGEVQRQVERWDDGPNDRSAFSIFSPPPVELAGWIERYVGDRADPPLEFSAPLGRGDAATDMVLLSDQSRGRD
jgi:hypothetical protein